MSSVVRIVWLNRSNLNFESVLDNLNYILVNHFVGIMNWIGKFVLKSIEQGASTTCYVALHPQVNGVSGEYFSNNNIATNTTTSLAKDSNLAKKLWEFSLDLTNNPKWLYGFPLIKIVKWASQIESTQPRSDDRMDWASSWCFYELIFATIENCCSSIPELTMLLCLYYSNFVFCLLG